MSVPIRMLSAVLAACLLAGAVQTADAQLLKRAQDRLKRKTQEKAAAKVDSAADQAVDQAATRIVEGAANAVTGAVGGAADSAAAASGTVSGTGGGAGGGAAVGAGDGAAGAVAGAAMLQALGAGAAGGGGAEPVDFRRLKDLLPASVHGWARSQATGQKSSALGIKSSSAEADYANGDGSTTVHLTITDLGTMTSWGMLGYAWLNTEVDSETESGYERTVKFHEYPAYEKYDHGDNYASAEFTLIVGQRFVVSFKGDGVGVDALKEGAGQIDYAQLEKMKAESAAATQAALADFRALKALLPATAAGMPRTSHSGQQTSAQGFQVSTGEADYAQDQRHIHVTITDMGGMSGLAALGYAWTGMQIDSESDHGFERTVKYGEHPGHQKLEHTADGSHAELQVVVKKRYVVALEGSGVEMGDLESALKQIDLDKLAAM